MASEHKIVILPDTLKVNDEKRDHGDDLVRLERAQWLRAAVLGANDGLLSTTSLMLGVAAAKESKSAMLLSGLAGALAGACSMAVGEYVSVSTQRDIEQNAVFESESKTSKEKLRNSNGVTNPNHVVVATRVIEEDTRTLPNPVKAAVASASSFLLGSCVPVFSALSVSSNNGHSVVVVVVVTSLALALFGAIGARLGGSPTRVSALRVLIGGWIAMGVTYGLLKPFDYDDDHNKGGS